MENFELVQEIDALVQLYVDNGLAFNEEAVANQVYFGQANYSQTKDVGAILFASYARGEFPGYGLFDKIGSSKTYYYTGPKVTEYKFIGVLEEDNEGVDYDSDYDESYEDYDSLDAVEKAYDEAISNSENPSKEGDVTVLSPGADGRLRLPNSVVSRAIGRAVATQGTPVSAFNLPELRRVIVHFEEVEEYSPEYQKAASTVNQDGSARVNLRFLGLDKLSRFIVSSNNKEESLVLTY